MHLLKSCLLSFPKNKKKEHYIQCNLKVDYTYIVKLIVNN